VVCDKIYPASEITRGVCTGNNLSLKKFTQPDKNLGNIIFQDKRDICTIHTDDIRPFANGRCLQAFPDKSAEADKQACCPFRLSNKGVQFFSGCFFRTVFYFDEVFRSIQFEAAIYFFSCDPKCFFRI